MLVGYACAPSTPVTSLRTRLIVGAVDKQIEVWNRARRRSRTAASASARCSARMPLRWERAAGGPDTSNPVGIPVGDARAPDVYGNAPLPNLQPPDVVVDGSAHLDPADRLRTDRRAMADAAGASVAAERRLARAALRPTCCSGTTSTAISSRHRPADQRLEELRAERADRPRELAPSAPTAGDLAAGTHVPVAFVDAPGAAPFELRLVADTLWIDTDRGVCTVTWRGTLPLRDPAQAGRIVVGLSEPGTRLTWADLHRHRDPRTVQPVPVNEVAASRVKRPDAVACGADGSGRCPLASAAAAPRRHDRDPRR